MADEDRLKSLREQIDAVDQKLLELLNERARLAQAVGSTKRESAEEVLRFYRPDREAAILRKVREANAGPLADDRVVFLFREVMSACLALEQPLQVAYLGPQGTFTQSAAAKQFGHAVGYTPVASIAEVFREVESENADYGVVPIENSSEGVVTHTLDMFPRSPLKICGEVELRVHHNLVSNAGRPEDVQRVYAHQQALAQCREWLDRNLPHAERVALSSNAEAARRAAEETGTAAVAAEEAATLYGLDMIARHIEDDPSNTTRFLVLGRDGVAATGDDKTSIMFSGPNRPGALFDMLQPLARRGISMTKIESRPARNKAWEYLFYVDLLGHEDDPEVAEALTEMRDVASLLTVLGAYPRTPL